MQLAQCVDAAIDAALESRIQDGRQFYTRAAGLRIGKRAAR
jgi:hypothetical protein